MNSFYEIKINIICTYFGFYAYLLTFIRETTPINTVGAKLKMAAKLKSQVTNAFKMHGLTLRR